MPGLNRYVRQHYKECMRTICLQDLSGKVITVDASIYMYRFLTDDGLLEGIFQLASIMQSSGVKLLFVFDGPPPPQKADTLKARAESRREAIQQLSEIEDLLETEESPKRVNELRSQLHEAKKKSVRLDRSHVRKVRELLDGMGVPHVEAEGEADGLCVKLVQKGKAYACLSEDMDMFVYGCPRVLRYLSMLNRTVVLYDTNKMLEEMDVTFTEFQQICILCGTDYAKLKEPPVTLETAMCTLQEYKKQKETADTDGFLEWLEANTEFVDNALDLYVVQYMFELRSYQIPKNCPNLQRWNYVCDREKMEAILAKEGFIFL